MKKASLKKVQENSISPKLWKKFPPNRQFTKKGHTMADATATDQQQPSFNLPTIPIYNDKKPELWLALVNMAMDTFKVQDPKTKKYLITTALPHDLQMKLADKIQDENITFQQLQDAIITAVRVPGDERIKKLLSNAPMGQRKPSEYLKYLRELAAGEIDKDSPVIRSVFEQNMPKEILKIIAPEETTSLDVFAATADRIHRYGEKCNDTAIGIYGRHTSSPTFAYSERQDANINNINLASRTQLDEVQRKHDKLEELVQSLSNTIAALQMQLMKHQHQVSDQIANMHRPYSSYPRSPSRDTRSPSRDTRSRSNSRQFSSGAYNSSPYCWYHRKFADKSTKCAKPCSWNKPDCQQKN